MDWWDDFEDAAVMLSNDALNSQHNGSFGEDQDEDDELVLPGVTLVEERPHQDNSRSQGMNWWDINDASGAGFLDFEIKQLDNYADWLDDFEDAKDQYAEEHAALASFLEQVKDLTPEQQGLLSAAFKGVEAYFARNADLMAHWGLQGAEAMRDLAKSFGWLGTAVDVGLGLVKGSEDWFGRDSVGTFGALLGATVGAKLGDTLAGRVGISFVGNVVGGLIGGAVGQAVALGNFDITVGLSNILRLGDEELVRLMYNEDGSINEDFLYDLFGVPDADWQELEDAFERR